MKREAKQVVISIMMMVSLSLFGCSASSSGTSNSNNSDAVKESESAPADDAGQTEESELKTEDFKDVVLVENDMVTITLEKFFQKESNYATSDGSYEPKVSNCISMKYKDKTEYGSHIDVDAYLNDEKLWAAISGGSNAVDGGKTINTTYSLGKDTQPDWEELDSYDDLRNVVLAFEITPKSEEGYLDGDREVKLEVNLGEAIDGKTQTKDDSSKEESDSKEDKEEPEKEEKTTKPIQAGDTINNDNWEITLVRAEITDEVLPKDTSSYYWSYSMDNDTLIFDLVYDVKCVSGKAKALNDVFGGARVTYANKYEFETIDVYYDDEDGHLRNSARVAFDPLQTWQIHYMICGIPKEAATSDEPLTALLLIDDQLWEYTYR